MVLRKFLRAGIGIAGLGIGLSLGQAAAGELFPQVSPRRLLPPPVITSPPAIRVPEPPRPVSPETVTVPRVPQRAGELETLRIHGEQVILRDGQVVYRSSAVKGVLVTPGQVILLVEPRE
ncbi:MAG: hypothetical protein HYY65_06600 [Candidatus Tectomicrobia bacterium]|uniref:Uncharacterized protein n=1 Tax=Tectimicrobiota bacterium TaxID=2528274 RepID=A0A932GPC9_UNCTE|nr:hypothetical protein [Candidatus Tectomicrobia bacterium]